MDIRFNYSGNSMNNMYFCNIFTFPVPQVYYLPPQVNPNPQNMFYTPMQFLENVPSYPFSASKQVRTSGSIQENIFQGQNVALQRSQKKPNTGEQNQKIKKQKQEQWSQKGMKNTQNPNLDRFVRKNVQSNVVNQVLSFLWTYNKNDIYLRKIFKNQQEIKYFIGIFAFVKTNFKSDFKRELLKTLVEKQNYSSPLMKTLRNHFNNDRDCLRFLISDDFRVGVRKLMFIYLRDINRPTMMTSRRMNSKFLSLHLRKCQEMIDYLFDQE